MKFECKISLKLCLLLPCKQEWTVVATSRSNALHETSIFFLNIQNLLWSQFGPIQFDKTFVLHRPRCCKKKKRKESVISIIFLAVALFFRSTYRFKVERQGFLLVHESSGTHLSGLDSLPQEEYDDDHDDDGDAADDDDDYSDAQLWKGLVGSLRGKNKQHNVGSRLWMQESKREDIYGLF